MLKASVWVSGCCGVEDKVKYKLLERIFFAVALAGTEYGAPEGGTPEILCNDFISSL